MTANPALALVCAILLLAAGCGRQSHVPEAPDSVVALDLAPAVDVLAPTPDANDVTDAPDVYSGFVGVGLVCTLTKGAYICPTLKDIPCRPDSNGVFRCNSNFGGCTSCASAPWDPAIWPDPAPWYASGCVTWMIQDGISFCVWLHSAACEPCHADADCNPTLGNASFDAHCIDYGPEGHFCATFCDHVACPDGYACVPTTGSAGKTQAACRRIDGKCPCPQLPFIGGETECHPVGLPDCTVTRTCVDGVLTPCDAAKCGK